MDNIFDEASGSLGQKSIDPMLAGIDGVSDELRSPIGIEWSAESSELKIENLNTGNDELLLSQNSLGTLGLSESQESQENTSIEEEDPLIGKEDNVGEKVDPLTDSKSNEIETKTRTAQKQDLAGNSRGKAFDIGNLDGTDFYTDSVSRSDRKDFYKFSVDARGQVEIDLSDLNGNADLYLRNSKGKEIKKSKRNGAASESISHILNPGEYYIQVQSRNKQVSTDYHLGMRFIDTESFSASLGKNNPQDFYSLTVNKKEDVYITLGGLSGNVDLYLLDSNQKVIDKSKLNGKRTEQIQETLVPGDYYVEVKRRNSRVSSDYTLDLGSKLWDLPGNNRSKAYNFGTMGQDQETKLRQSVSRSDQKDFYKFTLEESAEIDISLAGLKDNADLYLHNSKGKVIKKSKNNGTTAESISHVLSSGDYYIQVKTRSKSDSTDYYLGFELEKAPPDDAGNSRGKALDIGSLSQVLSYSDFVGSGDRLDFYTFTLDWERNVNISLDELTGNADLFLLNRQGKVIEKSKRGGTNIEKIEENLAAGTYYVRVQARNNNINANYSLTLEAENNQETLTVLKENLNLSELEDIGFELIDEPVEVEKGVYFIGTGPTVDQFDPIPLNESSANTTNTDQLWSGRELGLNLDGSGVTVGVWDQGKVRDTHQEFAADGGSRVNVGDDVSDYNDHATHVAGIIGATGVDKKARGMANQVEIISFDFQNDIAEIDEVAKEIDISNHSYGGMTGWNRKGKSWLWTVPLDEDSDEDPDFGKYSNYTKELDKVLYDNPHLLSVWAAGNDRDDKYNGNQSYYLATFVDDSKIPDNANKKMNIGMQ
ncbi:pre-peptidase C-terminal domain-containing protein [Okeania sp. KiyG1]|uniref:pre-peptidase C-terminal domain-containing protein n=1 Tax=Okeania sp. KiyG1 TaxID=2720165 RepID=UPI0019235A9C|nr:pre-peptidase C-terminal domain-containing protein [Okeania sp. KiyG1]GGA29799.1 hypothetical protein CYANOKiyG1_46240 [Okeania sp. KiyG1]